MRPSRQFNLFCGFGIAVSSTNTHINLS